MFLKRELLFSDDEFACLHKKLDQWNVSISLCECIGIHSDVVDPTDLTVLVVQRTPNGLNVDRNPSIARDACCLVFQVIVQRDLASQIDKYFFSFLSGSTDREAVRRLRWRVYVRHSTILNFGFVSSSNKPRSHSISAVHSDID